MAECVALAGRLKVTGCSTCTSRKSSRKLSRKSSGKYNKKLVLMELCQVSH